MDAQSIINIAIGLCGALGGFLLKAVWDGLKELRAADILLTEKVQKIEVLVAGHYVTWDGLKDVMRPMAEQLNRIEQKLDGKADK